MNLFFNYNCLDNWLQENVPNSDKNVFLNKEGNEQIYDLFKKYTENNGIVEDDIASINVVVSFKNYKEINPVDTQLFVDFNKEWNINLLKESQKFITFCRINNKYFNFIFVYHQNGKHNIANIAMSEILKSYILGLHSETKPFKFFSKLIVLDRSKKKYLKKINEIILSNKKIIISNSKIVDQKKIYKDVFQR